MRLSSRLLAVSEIRPGYGSDAQNGNYSNFLYDLSSDEIEAHNLFDHMTYGETEHNLKLVTQELALAMRIISRRRGAYSIQD